MQARIVPASRGARWLGEGWQIFRVAPLGWLALVFAYLFGTQVVALVPVVGMPVALLAVPGLTVGMVGAARAASRGGSLRIGMLLDGFRDGWRGQLLLGAVYLACSIAVFLGLSLADEGGALRAAMSGRADAEPPETDAWLRAVLVFAALYLPIMMMFWFAPMLAAWHSAGAAKALFFSFFACLMNWRAFLAYGAVTLLAVVAAPLAALSLILVVAGGGARPQLAPLMLPLVILILPTLFASFYASYRDVFGAQAEGGN